MNPFYAFDLIRYWLSGSFAWFVPTRDCTNTEVRFPSHSDTFFAAGTVQYVGGNMWRCNGRYSVITEYLCHGAYVLVLASSYKMPSTGILWLL